MAVSQSSRRASARARCVAAFERVSVAVSAGIIAVTSLIGCGGIGDENYVPLARPIVNQADLNNAPFCVGTCEPDYGSQAIDCSAEAGLEFFPEPVMTGGVNGDPTAVITRFYSYNDNTSDFMVSGPAAYSPAQTNYEPPPAVVFDKPSCVDGRPVQSDLGQNVHHIRGGLFREWGGGMGRNLTGFVTNVGCLASPSREGDPDYCADADPRIEAIAGTPEYGVLAGAYYGMVADLRGWEGISFWARQGPNNTGGIRVYVGDRQLDDDVAYYENEAGIEPLCGRVRECGCRNHRPCTQGDGGLTSFYCWDPAIDGSIAELRRQYTEMGAQERFEARYACGETMCNDPNPTTMRADPLFSTATATPPGTSQCLPYKLTNDLEDYFCYDPENPATFPADGPRRCGDGWAKGVTLTQNWQLYTVPFTELRQEGYAQEFQYLDLSKITLVRFTWSQGWVDVWLDDVRFYRHASGEQQSE